ncbi:hypothetical protein [Christiangramia crocea]|uniref:MBOAT family protein n=1 Tax=Christiangramia crocea TaxID=2904124 RepID=A0A9X1UUU3_9FLAO|nr:hypothetical protein [Gramella crocea]MCG9970450.1 hypothetical protein [Gramella crocea]
MEVIAENSYMPSLKEFGQMSLTFFLTVIAWVFFRAENIRHAVIYLGGMINSSVFSFPELVPKRLFLLLPFFIFLEWFGRKNQFPLEQGFHLNSRTLRFFLYFILGVLIIWSGSKLTTQEFIYFQF